MYGTLGRLLDLEQVAEGSTSGETFRSNPFNKLGNERKVRDRPRKAGVVGAHAWFLRNACLRHGGSTPVEMEKLKR
jgi:hypothetical protein